VATSRRSSSAPWRVPEGTDTNETAQRALAQVAAAFAAAARTCGLTVPISTVVAFDAALVAVSGYGPAALYWAGRSLFVHGPGDVAAYDQAYRTFFFGHHPLAAAVAVAPAHPFDQQRDDEGVAAAADGGGPELPGVGATVTERLSSRDFGALTGAELAEMHALMERIGVRAARRRTRRRLRSGSGRVSFDLRATVRRASRSGGELLVLEHRRRRSRPRRLVAICDVSGSMDPYARELVRFLHVCVAGRSEVEAFALGTRLTRLTRQLAGHDGDVALALAAGEVPDWAGGTRLGEGLQAFNDRYGIRGMARGATVLICSDGIDRGDPELLAGELGRLRRVAHRIVWVNPLQATPGYQPTARGMAAALPYLDDFLPGHSLDALVEVASRVAI
jgi:uncharacterized protein with von Willebrand factor type A (vWA) domain